MQRVYGLGGSPDQVRQRQQRLMGEIVRFEIMPDGLDVVQFRRVPGQSLDGEPMRAGGASVAKESLLVWIGQLSSTSTTRLVGWPGLVP
jgi:hypothetical protein